MKKETFAQATKLTETIKDLKAIGFLKEINSSHKREMCLKVIDRDENKRHVDEDAVYFETKGDLVPEEIRTRLIEDLQEAYDRYADKVKKHIIKLEKEFDKLQD